MPAPLRFLFFSLLFIGVLALAPAVLAADTDPPQTQLNLVGTTGSNGWYISTVNADLRTADVASGPASTTYTLDSGSPIVNAFSGASNAVLNPSFEDGDFFSIGNWDKVASGFTFLYQSATPSKFGYGSAAVLSISSQFQYWTNVNSAVPVAAGQTYNASTWVKTVNIVGPGAWMETWAKDSTGAQSDILLDTSDKVIGTWEWQQLYTQFTVPAGYDFVYFKLGDRADSGGFAFFDGVTMNAGTDGVTQFSIIENGVHALKYYSTDNAGNVEATHTQSPIKIDTVNPQDWTNFHYSNSGNNHTFTMMVDVRDVTSGINPATAQFQTYDKNGCDCWSAWMNVATVKRVDNGANAAAGYTGYVTVTTPSYDFGNSAAATTPQVQFRINDMAASIGVSPIYALFGPWIQLLGSADVYSGGSISIKGATPTGSYSANGVIATAGDTISGLNSLTQWYARFYPIPKAPVVGLQTYIPNLDQLKAGAKSLTSGKLPSTSGVYLFNGKYTIDSNTLNAGFQTAVYNAVVIVNGDLAINQNYQLNKDTGLIFLVSGQIVYKDSTTQSAGILMSAGNIATGGGGSQLVHTGSLISLGGLSLGRDLGRNGNPNNLSTPAEKIIFPSQLLYNQGLARLLNGGATSDFHWQEAP